MNIVSSGDIYYIVNRFGMRLCDDYSIDMSSYSFVDNYVFVYINDTVYIYGEEGLCFPGCEITIPIMAVDSFKPDFYIKYKGVIYDIYFNRGYFYLMNGNGNIDPYLNKMNNIPHSNELYSSLILRKDNVYYFNGRIYFNDKEVVLKDYYTIINDYFYITKNKKYLCSVDNKYKFRLNKKRLSVSRYDDKTYIMSKDMFFIIKGKDVIYFDNAKSLYSNKISINREFYFVDTHLRFFKTSLNNNQDNNKTLMDYTDNNFRYVVGKDSLLQFKFI